jgi:hypothetical protein
MKNRGVAIAIKMVIWGHFRLFHYKFITKKSKVLAKGAKHTTLSPGRSVPSIVSQGLRAVNQQPAVIIFGHQRIAKMTTIHFVQLHCTLPVKRKRVKI